MPPPPPQAHRPAVMPQTRPMARACFNREPGEEASGKKIRKKRKKRKKSEYDDFDEAEEAGQLLLDIIIGKARHRVRHDYLVMVDSVAVPQLRQRLVGYIHHGAVQPSAG